MQLWKTSQFHNFKINFMIFNNFQLSFFKGNCEISRKTNKNRIARRKLRISCKKSHEFHEFKWLYLSEL